MITDDISVENDTCLLPVEPDFGQWFIVGETRSYHTGEQVSLGTTLEIVCDETYMLIGQSKIICAKNGWSDKIGQCLGKKKRNQSDLNYQLVVKFQ